MNLGQVVQPDPVSCWQESQNVGPFYFGAEPYIEDALGNSSGMGEGEEAAYYRGAPDWLPNCSGLSPVLGPPVPLHISPPGFQEGSLGPGLAPEMLLSHMAQVRPRQEPGMSCPPRLPL